MAAILLSSNRDRVKLQEGGYLYVFDKLSTNGEKKFWRCERKSECNARIHTDAITNVVVKRASEHNHPSNVEITSSGSVVSGPKRRAYEPIDDLSQLDYLQMRFSRDSHYFNHLLATDALQKMIQRKKMRIYTNAENRSPPHATSNNGYANEGVSVEEVMAQGDDGRTNLTTEQSSIFLSGIMAVKEETLSKTQQRQQTNFKDRSTINTEHLNERAPEIAATSTASITASLATSSALPTIAAVRPKRSTPQVNVIPIGVDKYLTGGFVCWSQKIALIIEDSELVVRMVCNSDKRPFASILFTGAPNTGKSCLAAIATKCIERTMVRVCSGDDMIALTDVAKVTALRKVLEDTYSNTLNIVLLDNVDRLIEYCPVGPRYSNVVLQALLILLKKTPPPNHRLLIIATASDQCARAFGMHDLFTAVFDVPPLSTVDHLMAVIEDSGIFTDADYGRFRSRLSERSSSYSIGVKRLLDVLELAKQSDPRTRVDFVCTQLEKLISI